MNTVLIPGGLGDAMAVAASIQFLAEQNKTPYNLVTLPAMEPVLRYHPLVKWRQSPESNDYLSIRWASQYREQNLWHLHIKQKYSYQLGFFIDPTYTIDVYNKDGTVTKNKPEGKTVLVNLLSNLPSKRFVPIELYKKVILPILEENGYTPIYIGSNPESSITSIDACIDLLRTGSLFIGPISGMAYIAEAIGIKRMIFCSSVPYYKDMSFENLIPIMMQEPCIYDCELMRRDNTIPHHLYEKMGCNALNCKATFSEKEVEIKLKYALGLYN